MVRYDQQLCSLKNNKTLDLVTLPLERRDKRKFLHEKLEGKINMERPKGYIDSLLKCKLRNPLYELKHGTGNGIPSSTLPYYQRGLKDARLDAKETTFILLCGIILEEGGEVHMHYTRELVHIRTITLHYCSTKMQL